LDMELIDNDRAFAAALKRFGKAMIPADLELGQPLPTTPVFVNCVTELYRDPTLEKDDFVHILRAKNFSSPDLPAEININFDKALAEALLRRITDEVAAAGPSFDKLRARILPKIDPQITGSTQLRALKEQFERYKALESLHRFALPEPSRFPKLIA